MQIHEIFTSIDGEVNFRSQGRPATFIRVAGCNLCCPWCDVPEAQSGGTATDVEEVAQRVMALGCPNITITGGEPLLQAEEVLQLTHLIRLKDTTFSIETNGTIPPFNVFPPSAKHIAFVVDYKLPSSGVKGKYITSEFNAVYGRLRPTDWIKFVIADDKDYEIAHYIAKTYVWNIAAQFAFSPLYSEDYTEFVRRANHLTKRMIADKLWHVTLNCQLHKLIRMP